MMIFNFAIQQQHQQFWTSCLHYALYQILGKTNFKTFLDDKKWRHIIDDPVQ